MILDKLKTDYNNIHITKINLDLKALMLIIIASIIILVIFGFVSAIFIIAQVKLLVIKMNWVHTKFFFNSYYN